MLAALFLALFLQVWCFRLLACLLPLDAYWWPLHCLADAFSVYLDDYLPVRGFSMPIVFIFFSALIRLVGLILTSLSSI